MVRAPGGLIRALNRRTRMPVVPVGSTNDDSLPSDIMAREAKVVVVERPVHVDDLSKVADDVAVISNLVAAVAPQVKVEAVKAGVPLLEHDGLSLDLADLLRDDPCKFRVSMSSTA